MVYGHLAKGLNETVYFAVLNNLQLWGPDVGNAYLQALTKEKLYILVIRTFFAFLIL